ncbi:MAG TPA: hypothetical protein VEE84_04880, partial [Burkholderiaceae bacterium]|nr:hypothetical protein [Burkholderiaceae bacterium]
QTRYYLRMRERFSSNRRDLSAAMLDSGLLRMRTKWLADGGSIYLRHRLGFGSLGHEVASVHGFP